MGLALYVLICTIIPLEGQGSTEVIMGEYESFITCFEDAWAQQQESMTEDGTVETFHCSLKEGSLA